MKITLFFKKNIFIFILALALVLRLFLTPMAFHDDILTNTTWGEWVYKNGPLGFFEHQVWLYSWPTQPPLITLLYGFNHYIYDRLQWAFSNIGLFIATYRLIPTKMIWFFDFNSWFGHILYKDTPLQIGAMISMKLLAIFADIGIASIIFFLGKGTNRLRAILLSAAYLFSPFSWYLSALWGQYDQLGCFFLLLAFVSVVKKWFFWVPILMLLSIELKPTTLIFIPLLLAFIWYQRPSVLSFLSGLIVSLIIFVYTILIFTDSNIITFIREILIPKIFFKAEFRVSTNSFNFWHILIGDQALNQNTLFLWIPAKIWGWTAFLVLYVSVLKVIKSVTFENVFKSLTILGIGSWLFLTNMLDRYVFAGIVSLLILCIYNKELFRYWFVLSIIFWLNLFNHWWFPSSFSTLQQIMTWQGSLFTRFLALANLILFLVVLRKINFSIDPKMDFKKLFSLKKSVE